jgi:ubiquitin-protein ligase E3 A
MTALEVECLIRSYFRQFTVGCENAACSNPDCRSSSCPSADLQSFVDANDAAILAVRYTLQHSTHPNRLCPNVNVFFADPAIGSAVDHFDSVFRPLIAAPVAPKKTESARSALSAILTAHAAFPFILRRDDSKLSLANLATDDELLQSLSDTLQRSGSALSKCQKEFDRLAVTMAKMSNCHSFHHVRALLLLFCFTRFFTAHNFLATLVPLLQHISSLHEPKFNLFFRALQRFPNHLRRVLNCVHDALTRYLDQSGDKQPEARHFAIVAMFLSHLKEFVADGCDEPLPGSAFSSDRFTRIVQIERCLEGQNWLAESPVILTIAARNELLRRRLKAQQAREERRAVLDGIPQPFLMLGIIPGQAVFRLGHFCVDVRRDHLIDDTVREISRASDKDLLRPLAITFVGEEGIDAGGVSREFFHLVIEQLFSPDYGMFKVLLSRYYWFNPSVLEDTQELFRTLGTVVALAVYNQIVLPIRFPLLTYKKLLGKPIGLADMREIEAEMVNSFKQMLDMPKNGDDVADLGLTFVASQEFYGTAREVPLKPGGQFIEVTNANVEEYVRAYVDWYTGESVRGPFRYFTGGFQRLLQNDMYKAFSPDELDILVSGEEVLEWNELEKNAKYDEGYRPSSKAVKMFWEVFRELSPELKKKFLVFTTGTDRAPMGGLGNVVITIRRAENPAGLPVSHTCFSLIELPEYQSKDEMRRKLTVAITETEGFGIR